VKTPFSNVSGAVWFALPINTDYGRLLDAVQAIQVTDYSNGYESGNHLRGISTFE